MNEAPPPRPAVERAELETMLHPISGSFLLPDRVELDADGRSATGIMEVRDGREYTDGHFGVLPGVMQIELAQQTLGVLMKQQHAEMAGVMWRVEQVEIGMMAQVGDTVSARVTVAPFEVRRGRARPEADVVLRKVGDDTRQSTMKILPQMMSRALFGRLIKKEG